MNSGCKTNFNGNLWITKRQKAMQINKLNNQLINLIQERNGCKQFRLKQCFYVCFSYEFSAWILYI